MGTPVFKEGDVIVLRAGPVAEQDRGILLRNEAAGEGWWTICFVYRARGCLDLFGIRESAFEYYRLATPKERWEILSAMVGKKFGTHRGLGYFIRWQEKYKAVIEPLVGRGV